MTAAYSTHLLWRPLWLLQKHVWICNWHNSYRLKPHISIGKLDNTWHRIKQTECYLNNIKQELYDRWHTNAHIHIGKNITLLQTNKNTGFSQTRAYIDKHLLIMLHTYCHVPMKPWHLDVNRMVADRAPNGGARLMARPYDTQIHHTPALQHQVPVLID